MGHQVTVYEQRAKLGGMLRYGIPDYRLPQYVLDRDIEHILSAGIEVHTNVSVGTDVAIPTDNTWVNYPETALPKAGNQSRVRIGFYPYQTQGAPNIRLDDIVIRGKKMSD